MQRIFVRVDGFILSLDRFSIVLVPQKISFYNGELELTSWLFEHEDSAEKMFELLWSMISDVTKCENPTTLDLNTYEVNEDLNNFKVMKVLGREFESDENCA